MEQPLENSKFNVIPNTGPKYPSELNKESKTHREVNNQQQLTSPITISNVQFFENERNPTTEISHKIYRNSNHNPNAANIFRVKATSGIERKDKFTYVRYENHTSARTRKTTEQKIFQINSFVKKLTENMNQDEQVPEISDTKFRALKKIIEYYDIKNLDRSEYSNVIGSFGLQIGTMRAEQKTNTNYSEEKRNEVKKLRAMLASNRTARKIEPKSFSQTFDQSQSQKGSTIPPRQSLNESCAKNISKNQALSLFNSLQVRKDKIKCASPRKFRFSSGQNCITQKVNKYRQFLFMLNYSNKLYRPLDLESYPVPLKFYIGRGNNGNLIRSLMRKRFWFEETNEKDAHFVWTQIKVPQIFNKQPPIQPNNNELSNKSARRSPSRLPIPKNQGMNRILTNDEVRQMVALQETIKTRKTQGFEDRIKLCSRKLKKELISLEEIVHNHFPGNGLLGNKKALFLCLKEYCRLTNLQVFDIVPRTFIISNGLKDPQLAEVISFYNEQKKKKKANFWIMKPGEFSNRGNGIECTNKIDDINRRVIKCQKQNKRGSLIVQQYITRPLLYNGRKFDLRTYMLVTCHNGKTKSYWYQDGYVRTSSAFFSLNDVDPYIHLTNDAVQKNADDYSYFEEGNKLSYSQLQRYLDSLPTLGRTLDISTVLIPKMKDIAGLAVRSSWLALNREWKDKNFELFGLDFMVDEDFKPWLIEVNTNPCLELSSPVLERLVPHMIENVLRIGLDSIYPPPDNFSNNYKYNIPENSLHYNKFQLIFDSDRDGPGLKALYDDGAFFNNLEGLQEDKSEFKQEGQLINVDEL